MSTAERSTPPRRPSPGAADYDEIRYVPDELVEAFTITDTALVQELKARREATGHGRRDEMWEGIYVVSPEANIEHEDFSWELSYVFGAVRGEVGGARIRTGGNISDRVEEWHKNYRVPDVAVYLSGNPARNCGTHMCGGPDLAVEILSKGDLARKKLDFYAKIGTREVLILDRYPWTLELYRMNNGQLILVGVTTPGKLEPLTSEVFPLSFRLVPGEGRPTLEVARIDGGQFWRI
jgi:Uma2 family endonuclease